MRPFKKKNSTNLPSAPVLEPIPPYSAIENRFLSAVDDDPAILAQLRQMNPDTIITRFPGVGVAAADLTTSAQGDMAVYWHTWLEHDEHAAYRVPATGDPALRLKNGHTVEITMPTSMAETLYRGLLFPLGDFDHIMALANTSLGEQAVRSVWENLSQLPFNNVGVGSRVQTPDGIRSPRCYNATGRTPSRGRVRSMNFSAFKNWLRDPWGRYRHEHPSKASITSSR